MIDERDIARKLNAIVCKYWRTDTWYPYVEHELPFPITSPAAHATKPEFKAEQKALASARKGLDELKDFMRTGGQELPPRPEYAARLRDFFNGAAWNHEHKPPTTPSAVVRNAALDVGLTECAFELFDELDRGLRARERMLKRQEKIFWSRSARAKNHHAYAIALSLARTIFQLTGKCPTFGTSAEGSHPSTDYGRALEEVYEVLGMKVNLRGPANWAIAKMKAGDTRPFLDLMEADALKPGGDTADPSDRKPHSGSSPSKPAAR